MYIKFFNKNNGLKRNLKIKIVRSFATFGLFRLSKQVLKQWSFKGSASVKTHRFNISCAQQAFTMAEAILVMTVLGIIATVMITVMKPAQYKEKAYETKSKQLLATVDEAFNLILLNETNNDSLRYIKDPDNPDSTFPIFAPNKTNEMKKVLSKYLKLSRTPCEDASCYCYARGYDREISAGVYLSNGACIGIYMYASTSFTRVSVPGLGIIDKKMRPPFGGLLMDINGAEGPNKVGVDRHMMPLNEFGIDYELQTCNLTKCEKCDESGKKCLKCQEHASCAPNETTGFYGHETTGFYGHKMTCDIVNGKCVCPEVCRYPEDYEDTANRLY